ncbi:MAG: MerR family transcriptional regulator [Thiomonas sp.]
MNDRTLNIALQFGIAAVERDTGIGKDTLRVWERRYGFPQPQRDASGDRLYPLDQVERLRLIKRLLDGGRRPAQIVPLSMQELDALARETPLSPAATEADPLAEGAQPPTPSSHSDEVNHYLALLKRHDGELLRRSLQQDVMRMGIGRFISEVIAPLTVGVGDAWMRGELEVFEEHLYSEVLQRVLRTVISAIPQGDEAQSRPKVLLTTVPQEPHTLGLLMVEAMLALEGCRCVQLGAQMPLGDILKAVQAHAADVLVLSFSPILQTAQVLDALTELRSRMPQAVDIWVGGSHVALRRRLPEGIRVTGALSDLGESVQDWRQRHQQPPAASIAQTQPQSRD